MNWIKLASIGVVTALFFALLILGRPILEPIAFSILFMLLLTPLSGFYERFMPRPIGIICAFLTTMIPVLLAFGLFGLQLSAVISELSFPEERIRQLLDRLAQIINGGQSFQIEDIEQWAKDNFSTFLDAPLTFLQSSITSSTSFLINSVMVAIYTFFLLLYRDAIKDFLLIQFEQDRRGGVKKLIHEIKQVVQEYLYGLGLVILIIGVLNSVGLWLIGIGYPVFWGFLAAMLTVVPYIGTTLGGALPFIYALITTGTLWQPVAIVLLYFTIQTIEGNFITPNVVGSSIKINPPVAIFAIFLGGFLWGITGLILALPFMGILKSICDHIDFLKPVGLMLADKPHKDRERLYEEFNKKRYRLFSQISKKRP